MNEMIANRYLLAGDLGHGGMADVYLAIDTVLNREVAIKFLRGELSADPVALLRFQREANAASALVHPNIIEIYDVGEYNGRQYIVMEYVRGKSLKQLIALRGALDVKEASAIMEQLTSAVAEAHKQHIIHRDIKPQNVLVKDDGTVKITDFGIALAQDSIQLTQTDSVMGSVHYLAPEVARGEMASEQSDVYSLGVVFYELLTGDVPFHGESAVQIAMKHLREEMPSVKNYDKNIPQSIDNLIIKATAKNKIYRYHNAQAMLNDLSTAFEQKRITESRISFDDEKVGETKKIPKLNQTTTEKKSDNNFLFTGTGILLIVVAIACIFGLSMIMSSQSKKILMPDLSGMTVEQAKKVITDSGLIFDGITYQITDDIEKGIVISSTPSADVEVEKGTIVNLTVSNGMYFIIDDYTGKTPEEVKSLLSKTGIQRLIEKEYNPSVLPGRIIRQEMLLKGDKCDPSRKYEIKLVVSAYPELTIPVSITGMNIFEAKNLLEEKGAVVKLYPLPTEGLTEEEKKNIIRDTVVKSSPEGGRVYTQYEDTRITLYYY